MIPQGGEEEHFFDGAVGGLGRFEVGCHEGPIGGEGGPEFGAPGEAGEAQGEDGPCEEAVDPGPRSLRQCGNEGFFAPALQEVEAGQGEHEERWQKAAWSEFTADIKTEINAFVSVLQEIHNENQELKQILTQLTQAQDSIRRDLGNALHQALRITVDWDVNTRKPLLDFYSQFNTENFERYSSHLHSESLQKASSIETTPLELTDEDVDGYKVVRACFETNMDRDPRIFAFGEDVGKIGDVNQGFSGLQDKFGELRVTDKGIREWSIIGEGIGAAMRGLRPIAEIQYLDYLLYALEPMSDDLATLQYRTKGGQNRP